MMRCASVRAMARSMAEFKDGVRAGSGRSCYVSDHWTTAGRHVRRFFSRHLYSLYDRKREKKLRWLWSMRRKARGSRRR